LGAGLRRSFFLDNHYDVAQGSQNGGGLVQAIDIPPELEIMAWTPSLHRGFGFCLSRPIFFS
jgi:hypothetical protein